MNGSVAHPSDPSLWSSPFLCTSLSAPCSHIWSTAGPYTSVGKHWSALLPLFSEKPLSFFLKLSTSKWASRGLQAGSDLIYVALFNEFINMCLTTLISSLAGPDAFSLSHSQLQSYAPILYCEEPRYLFIVWQLLLDTARTCNPTPGVWAKLFVLWAFMPSVS